MAMLQTVSDIAHLYLASCVVKECCPRGDGGNYDGADEADSVSTGVQER